MKISQDPKSGRLDIQLEKDEQYDIEEHLDLLMEFVSQQAIKIH